MIRKTAILGVSAIALSLAAANPALAQDQESEEIQAPLLSYPPMGIDTELLDTSVDPGDDFFAYVNGKWVAETEIPADKSSYGAFHALGEKSQLDVKSLMTQLVEGEGYAAGSTEQRLVDAYNAYMDVDAINAKGLVPAQPYLNEIYAANTLDQMVELFAKPGFSSMVGAGVTVDRKDPESYIVSIGFDGMGLPDRDYYLVDSERNQEIRTKYKEYLSFLFGKLGYEDPAAAAEAVYSFELATAALEWDRVALRNADLTYQKHDRAGILALAGDFPLAKLLEAGGYGDVDRFVTSQVPPTAEEAAEMGLDAKMLSGIGGGLPAFIDLVEKTPVATLQAFMAKNFLDANASILPSDIYDAKFAFFSTTLSGIEQQQPRWKMAINTVQGMLGEQLGKAYAERYFPSENKAAMSELVENLRTALSQSVTEIDWMGEATKEEAQAKLASFNPKIGYPDEFENYEGLTIVADSPLANKMASAEWYKQDNLSKLGKPVDKTEWGILPQTVNAYYNAVFNEIVFPAAILQQPFFALTADPAVNYGAIGAVIGHEMGHGFDDQGSKFDAAGAQRNWWTDEDRANFDKRTTALAGQYDQFCPYDEGKTCVNGKFTLGENIGDVGGLSMAYRAYRLSLDGKEAPVINGLTGDQRFYIAWAQVWRGMVRENYGRQMLQVDPHSPYVARVNYTLRNQDAWYKAFNVTEDDALYLAPEDRVKIW
ncbi:Peptidase M13 family protein [Altererythrobacter epoxidivorans]|uniref:Peptidase M13 family protein n=1 Tax=Altererythrobacter epoxidivorans TaxID=361183 RepID=A0A0M3TAU2_9SPHN|nr:M13 family metallopeptidase [Altererythrobacter epoxidivorans]ALE17642.1 Peptidase M13 family protein [Altererythrobacter epoxidivorans]